MILVRFNYAVINESCAIVNGWVYHANSRQSIPKFQSIVMLRPILTLLEGRKVILASGSPRRKDILEHIGLPFDVIPSGFEENIDKSSFTYLWQYAVETARGKAKQVAERLKNDSSWAVILGADTIVVKDNIIHEKPSSIENAREMLNKFNNSQHLVYTGVVFIYRTQGNQSTIEHAFHECSEVTFGNIPEEAIEAYIQSKEPFDKAGGYGIQDLGGTLVSSINGDYFNVEGLPLHKVCMELYGLLKKYKLAADNSVNN